VGLHGGDMRALVTATRQLLGVPARGPQQQLLPLQDETQDDLPLENEDPEEINRLGPSHGIWIAVATFVPTFLVTFFGVAYLAGLPMGTRFPSGLKSGPPPVTSTLAPQRDLVAPPGQARAPMREGLQDAAVPATTPAIPRPASGPTRPQGAPKATELKRSVSTVTKDDAWVRAAAFSDRDSAERFAASIERQGYPVNVRRGDTPNTPWVVWIGKHPRGMTPSERRK
jgi:hypothetical protein